MKMAIRLGQKRFMNNAVQRRAKKNAAWKYLKFLY